MLHSRRAYRGIEFNQCRRLAVDDFVEIIGSQYKDTVLWMGVRLCMCFCHWAHRYLTPRGAFAETTAAAAAAAAAAKNQDNVRAILDIVQQPGSLHSLLLACTNIQLELNHQR